jgi:hypothetical protein
VLKYGIYAYVLVHSVDTDSRTIPYKFAIQLYGIECNWLSLDTDGFSFRKQNLSNNSTNEQTYIEQHWKFLYFLDSNIRTVASL